MFPLGTVLFPHMPLRLRVFEERYLMMLSDMFEAGAPTFGVVLIERGRDVGGGEQRFDFGTIAEVTQLGAQEGFVGLLAQGGERFRVSAWLPDAPHPSAEIEPVPDLTWDDSLTDLKLEVEAVVRRTLALASEFSAATWPAEIELAADPMAAAWQLAAIAPLGPLDQLALLRSGSARELLERTGALTRDAALAWDTPWPTAPEDGADPAT